MSLNRKDLSTARKNPSMQHRHFAVIADVMRESKPAAHWDPNKMAQWQSTLNAFVAACKRSNSRFSESRFRAACEYEHAPAE